MRAGRERHLVKIEQVTDTTQDSTNQPIETWSTYIERWGRVRPIKGRELFTAAQRWPEVDYSITLRGDSRTELITEKMRVIANGKTFNILAVMDKEERGIQIDLMCRKEGN